MSEYDSIWKVGTGDLIFCKWVSGFTEESKGSQEAIHPNLPELSIWVKDTRLERRDCAHVLRIQRAMKDVCFSQASHSMVFHHSSLNCLRQKLFTKR